MISQEIPDFAPNMSMVEKNSITVKNDRDTVSIKPIRVVGELPGDRVDYEDSKVTLILNGAIDSATLKNNLSIEDTKGGLYQFEMDRIDDASFKLSIITKLKQSSDYMLKVDLRNYTDFSGNKVDSLFQNKFTTANELDFSGASGNVSNKDSTQTMVVLESAETIKRTYHQKTDIKKNFDFKKVIPGKYLVWSYKDRNKNGKYDNGLITPFKYSEEFKFYPDTLNLRARWPVGGVHIEFQ